MHSTIVAALFAAGALAGPIMNPDAELAARETYEPSVTVAEAASTPCTTSTSTATALPNEDSIDALLPAIVPLNTRGGDTALVAQLRTVATAAERRNLLNQPGDHAFDFFNPPDVASGEADGLGGRTVAATSLTFPALIGLGASMSVGFLGPCGLNTPHVHPRATELNIVVQGRLVTNFQAENGVEPVENLLTLYQMAAFPQGAFHQEFNPDCEDAVFVAAFGDEDPGVEQVAQTFFNLRPDAISATLNGVAVIDGQDIETFRGLIPANVAMGIDACLDRCGLARNAKRDVNELLAAKGLKPAM